MTGQTGNETIRLLMERASCRNFADRPVPPEVLRQILEAGTHAATGGNLQPYSIVKVENREANSRLAELCGRQPFIARAPVNLLFCIDFRRLGRWAELEDAPFTATRAFRHFWISFQDTVICAQTVCTAADAVGLGSVYVGTVLECFRELKEMFSLPGGVFPVVLLSLGYPAAQAAPRPKLGVDVVVHDERYRELSNDDLLAAFNAKYGRRGDPTPERLERIGEVCRAVGGEDLARRALARIESEGIINAAQRYFGLHYHADRMPAGNAGFLRTMEDFGFEWFKPGPAGPDA